MFTPRYIHSFYLLTFCWLAYPPLIFLYTQRVVKAKNFGPIDFLHLLPLMIAFGFSSPYLFLSSDRKLEILKNAELPNHILGVNYNFIFIILIMSFYAIASYLSFYNNNLSLNKNRWVKWVLGSFSCYVLAMAFYFILSRLGIISTGHDYFITYAIIFFIAVISYFGFVQPEVFDGLPVNSILPFNKYSTTGLTETQSKILKAKLLELMESDKPYLDNTIRLSDLGERLNLSRHHISQLINEQFDSSFFDFLNSYRIREAQELLLSENDLNITEVIFSSGFNNRGSFYKAFKKHTGVSPSQFKTQQTKE